MKLRTWFDKTYWKGVFLPFVLCCGCAASSHFREIDWTSLEKKRPLPAKIKIYRGHAKKLVAFVPQEFALVKRRFICGGKEVYHELMGNRLVAFVGVSYKEKRGFHCQLEVEGPQGRRKSYPLFELVLKKFQFEQEYLNVPKKHIELSSKNLARWKREVALQKKIYASGVKRPYFQESFTRPLESVVTSSYGRRRVFNNKRESWHSGTDFRAPVGTPIPVSNRGKVVFVGDLFFNGKVVIVDHGMNIFTMYCHLSKIKVEVGNIILKGKLIGLAGETGRVTGPHLHWGVKVNHQWISGLPFVEEGI